MSCIRLFMIFLILALLGISTFSAEDVEQTAGSKRGECSASDIFNMSFSFEIPCFLGESGRNFRKYQYGCITSPIVHIPTKSLVGVTRMLEVRFEPVISIENPENIINFLHQGEWQVGQKDDRRYRFFDFDIYREYDDGCKYEDGYKYYDLNGISLMR